MIYVARERLEEVEYLIHQSIQGHHILFESETLKRALAGGNPDSHVSEEESYSVEPHIERLIELETFRQKRSYLEKLDETTLSRVIRTYFHIVENNLFETKKERH